MQSKSWSYGYLAACAQISLAVATLTVAAISGQVRGVPLKTMCSFGRAAMATSGRELLSLLYSSKTVNIVGRAKTLISLCYLHKDIKVLAQILNNFQNALLSVCPSARLSVCPSVRLSVCLSIRLSVRLSGNCVFADTRKPFSVKNCTLINQTSNSVDVLCMPSFDGGLQQNFILELYASDSAIPRLNMTSVHPYFVLDHLEPDVSFRIVVFAVNSKGRSTGTTLEGVIFKDPDKRPGQVSITLSPILSILIGIASTLILVIVICIRVRNSHTPFGSTQEQKRGVYNNITSSTKPLLRSTSPKEVDEKEPDVVPAKYETFEWNPDRLIGVIKGPHMLAVDNFANYAQVNLFGPQWIDSITTRNEQCLQSSNPTKRTDSIFPTESRPKNICLENNVITPLCTQIATDLLNGLAIKERPGDDDS
ncbi:hypothetical protein NQ317_018674 [Molorchus minor]|uniref:Fibronectin type-III domain-containing protein n=1 Tax=Molorchus minor TaxID=1323400 RepID=A0ABQ9IQF4_9CUCU|nr:hypothetical protein NQ317_018674 [Molorchus minor]